MTNEQKLAVSIASGVAGAIGLLVFLGARKCCRSRDAFGLVSGPALFKSAKKLFGTTADVSKAGFVLPDGSMLDLSRHGGKYKDVSHGHIALAYPEDEQHRFWSLQDKRPYAAVTEFLMHGGVRMSLLPPQMPRGGGTRLIVEAYRDPTRAQERTLSNLVRMADIVTVDISDEEGQTVKYKDFGEFRRPTASAVLNFIKTNSFEEPVEVAA